MIKNLKIPEKRIPIIKSCKKKLEEKTKTKLTIEEKEIKISGEPIETWRTVDIVKAIGRGFNPDKSLDLLDEEKSLYIIKLKEYQKTEKGIKRLKSRIIGRQGKSKNTIEEIGNCNISVYGKTVSVIGESKKINCVVSGIEMLINGSKHNKVYNFLRRCLNG